MTCQRTEYRLNLLPVAAVVLLALAALFAVIPAASAQDSAPETPGKPTAKVVFQGGVDLEWNEVPGAESYDVQLYRKGQWIGLPGDGVAIAFYGAGAIISQLNHEGSNYWFQVRANNAHGSSDWSGYTAFGPTSEHAEGKRARPGNSPATGAPAVSGKAEAGETLAASVSDIADGNGLDRVKFYHQSTSGEGSGESDIDGAAGASYTVRPDDSGRAVRVRVAFTDRGGYQESLASSPVQVEGEAQQANTPATGAPAISGTAQVGQTLTAETSGIDDADRLGDAVFSYQWIANDENGDVDISGATGASYDMEAGDKGKAIKVRVSFTDDDGNEETLTSEATAAVAAAPTPLTAWFKDETETHSGSTDAFTFPIAFSEAIAISYQTFRDHSPEVTGGSVTEAKRVDGQSDLWEVTVEPDSNTDAGIALAADRACDVEEAVCTKEGKQLSNRLELTAAFVTEPLMEPPPAPTNLTAVVESGNIVLNWSAPSDESVTGYQVLRRRPTEGEDTLLVYVENTGSTAATYTDTNVTSGVRYVCRVKAINSAGVGAQPNFARATP